MRSAWGEVAVIVPCYSEAAVIHEFFIELVDALVDWTGCFVDDGTADATLPRLNALAAVHPRVRVYSLSQNFGHQIALASARRRGSRHRTSTSAQA